MPAFTAWPPTLQACAQASCDGMPGISAEAAARALGRQGVLILNPAGLSQATWAGSTNEPLTRSISRKENQ